MNYRGLRHSAHGTLLWQPYEPHPPSSKSPFRLHLLGEGTLTCPSLRPSLASPGFRPMITCSSDSQHVSSGRDPVSPQFEAPAPHMAHGRCQQMWTRFNWRKADLTSQVVTSQQGPLPACARTLQPPPNSGFPLGSQEWSLFWARFCFYCMCFLSHHIEMQTARC